MTAEIDASASGESFAMGSTSAAPVSAERLLGNLPSAVFALDGELRLVFANPAAESLFNSSSHLLAGRPLEDLVGPHATVLDIARQVAQQGAGISDYGVQLGLVRGETLTVDLHVAPIAEEPGRVVVVLHPCSAARRLDQHRIQAGSARSVASLAQTLAHEVKNPLSGIRGAAQLLEPGVGEEDKPLVRLICDETDRICALVDRMEAFGEGRPVERRPVNIHEVLEHVRMVAQAGFARAHRIIEQYDPSLPPVEGDRDQLIQLFLNLVKNAAEAAPAEGGRITLTTNYQHGLRISLGNTRERQELPITVDVRDNGPGVTPEILDHLFEPFVTTKPKGSGLGLALVAKIASDHGGVVACLPADPGTLFRVRLPASRHPRPARPNGSPR
jgi:two-component system nitrogen regulation sensor histidine kinase GlnL